MSRSLFRPSAGIDQAPLLAERKLVETLERRGLLKGAISLGALTFLSGCDVTNERSVQGVLTAMSSWNDRVQSWLFDPNRLAPTFTPAEVVDPPRYNAFYPIEDVVPVDVATWTLELGGLIADKRPWTSERLAALPQQDLIIRHVCVEGWDYIGHWAGVNLKSFLDRVGADTTARYVAFRSADGYVSSLDMASALHPQTILATHYAGRPLTEPFGAPLRLRTAVKLGFKNPKWLTAIEVTNAYPGGYWEDRGYNWYSGM
jgi:DMSO/TMAO reductase YedYZ molybdopterin-dependent catalytic subunit